MTGPLGGVCGFGAGIGAAAANPDAAAIGDGAGSGAAAAAVDVFVAYPGAAAPVMALAGMDLRVGAGERLVVQGPNGSGKSTLLRALTGELPVTAGSVWLAGRELSGLGAAARRRLRLRHVGFVDQHAGRALLPEWSVLRNVALQVRLAGCPAREALVRAADTLARLDLAHLTDRPVTGLSGGEAQRVAICAAVAHEPQLLLADEPTGELDEAAADQVYRMLASLSRTVGSALVLVSHDSRAADHVDRVVRVRAGRLAEQWFPGSDPAREQVLDRRGWLRLPSDVRDGRAEAYRVAAGPGGTLTLRPGRNTDRPAPADIGRPPADAGRDRSTVAERPTGPLTGSRPGPAARTDPPVRVEDVTLRQGGHELFAGIHLTVASGEWVTVTGPSGSGKSSLLRLIAGLLDPAQGRVVVLGRDWRPLSRQERAEHRRARLAVVPQSVRLAEALTVRENLALATRLRRTAPGATGRGADGRVTDGSGAADGTTPLGPIAALRLDQLLDRPVPLLSGGERQRVMLARSLMADPAVLVLDEPTSQQDAAAARLVAAAVTAARDRGAAIVSASHDPAFVAAADRVVRLGPPEPQPPRYAAATESSSSIRAAEPSMFSRPDSST